VILVAAVVAYAGWAGYLIWLAVRTGRPRTGADTSNLFFVLVVPALNEELVIGNTLRHLLSLAGDNFLVLVMDDGSDDRTAAVVSEFPPDKVRLVTREAPFARQGKGAVLNHAYEVVLTSELPEVYGEDNIVLVVMDADGQVDSNMLTAVAPYFADPRTAAVQTAVRMINARDNVLTRWQQYEFVTFNWLFSRARDSLGSVSLGGNGQFVRLSALVSLNDGPWTDCLTEDLDIGLRLRLLGWRNHYCHATRVSQQAVPSLRRLIRQRSRWFQGHISCCRYIPAVLASDMRAYCKADIVHYLLAPAVVLPLGLLSAASLVGIGAAAALGMLPGGVVSMPGDPATWFAWYLFGLGLAPLYAIGMWRDRQSSLLGSLLWSHLFTFGSYIWVAAGCIAVARMIRGRAGWLKTARVAVDRAVAAVAAHEGRPAGASRYLAAQASVGLVAGSNDLLPLRAENFIPRWARAELAGGTQYVTPVTLPNALTPHLILARGQAHLRRLHQLLGHPAVQASLPAAAPGTPEAAGDGPPSVVEDGLPAPVAGDARHDHSDQDDQAKESLPRATEAPADMDPKDGSGGEEPTPVTAGQRS
jgi:cellulose synthase/poly-beta-1,6-N-acetylglucosamine synthase-like glycosyltransferase